MLRGLEHGEGAADGEGWRRKSRGEGCGHGDGEESRPAEALIVNPGVFVWEEVS